MTITLTPEVEEAVAAQARKRNTTPEQIVQAALQRSFIKSGVLLKDYGIDQAQAAELRANLAPFASEWNEPEMDIYDNYDAAKSRL